MGKQMRKLLAWPSRHQVVQCHASARNDRTEGLRRWVGEAPAARQVRWSLLQPAGVSVQAGGEASAGQMTTTSLSLAEGNEIAKIGP